MHTQLWVQVSSCHCKYLHIIENRQRGTPCTWYMSFPITKMTRQADNEHLSNLFIYHMWHPAKPLLENRVEFVHCIVIIMHCLPKLFSQSRLFSKTPRLLFKRQNRVPGIFCFGRYRFADGPFKSNKIFIYFGRGSRTGQPDPNDRPRFFLIGPPTPALLILNPPKKLPNLPSTSP